jgi:hypothetical protein
VVDLLRDHFRQGRRFAVGRFIEQGDRVAVAVSVTDPQWSEAVDVYKVFTFRSDEDVVVRLNDCLDESYAVQVLAA